MYIKYKIIEIKFLYTYKKKFIINKSLFDKYSFDWLTQITLHVKTV